MKRISSLLLCLYCQLSFANGQSLSYVYIQGDKQTPFYVKLEGEMQPRYGKNYCIIPQLGPGPIHLDILFQQNVLPSRHFTVLVPENGSRGFLLTRHKDSIELYDLQQQFYLPNNNAEEDDHMPVAGMASIPKPDQVVAAPIATEKTVVQVKTKTKKNREKKPEPIAAKQAESHDSSEREHFIEGITLGNDHEAPATTRQTADSSTTGDQATALSTPSILNSDCPAPLSKEEFSPIYKDALDKADDEARTAYLLGKMNLCYATWQARALAGMLTTDAARFTLLQKIYPRISDQGAFPLLDDLLKGDSYKKAFHDLLHPVQ